MVDFEYTQMRYVLERRGLTWTDIPPVKLEGDVMQQVRRAGSASGETLLNSWLLLIVFANVPCI